MKKMVILALVALAVSGCSTVKYVNKHMATLNGQHINKVIEVIGYPHQEQVIAGKKLYIWNSSGTTNTVTPVFSSTRGSAVINPYSLNNRTYGTYNQSTTAYVPSTRHEKCVVTVEVDDAGIVLNSRTNGTRRGCKRFVRDFKTR